MARPRKNKEQPNPEAIAEIKEAITASAEIKEVAAARTIENDCWLYHPNGPEIFDRPYRGRIFRKGEPHPGEGWTTTPVKK